MNRNRVMRGLGLMALVLLAFGLAGCGSEPAPVARPPAPPPAPPPFQPQAVEVALGESGDTVTLMTAEGGGFTLNGEAFAGGEVESENGNKYLLALAEGEWTAAFQEPPGIEVMLGEHGGTVIITMTEDGKYFIGEMEITADTMVMGENGQYYTPGLDEEGMWMAVWVKPEAVAVMLGLSGMSVMLQQNEDGSYMIGDTAIESGGMHTADSGSTYTLTMGEDGMWMAAYQAPAPADVMLGDHGGTVMVSRAEDGSYMIGEMAIESGGMVTGANGQNYTLTMDDEGMWSGAWVMPDAVAVMLGDHGGSAMLQLAEDGTYWVGETLIESGGMVSGDNGQDYTLTMDDEGMWMGAWVMPDAVAVMLGDHGGSAMLQLAEDGTYWVGETLIESGGMVSGDNGQNYTLTMDDEGMWMGAWVMPDAVAVMLGDHGGSAMLQLAEDGTYWVGETLIESGGMVTGDNGHYYTLTMDDEGMWMGAWVMPDAVAVMLGDHGGSVMVQLAEDGSYSIGEMAIESGSTYTAINGNDYTLTMDDEGMWSGMYVVVTEMVTLSTHGGTITLSRMEDGSYMYGEMTIEQGSVVMMNDRSYALTMDDEGMWSAMYVAGTQMVTLGDHGGTITLSRMEDDSYMYGEMMIEQGSVVMMNDREYTLMMGDDGMWSAEYNPVYETLQLGTAESVELKQAEDMRWWIGEVEATDGYVHTADNGNEYTLTMDDEGMWNPPQFKPMMMDIAGTGLKAQTREDRDGYDVVTMNEDGSYTFLAETLPTSGIGDVMMDGAMYRVSTVMDDEGMATGDLMGERFDAPSEAMVVDREGNEFEGVIEDDDDTDYNEAGTRLIVDGKEHVIGDLFSDGMSEILGAIIVEKRRAEIEELVAQIKGLIAVNEAADDDDTVDFSTQFDGKWKDIDDQLAYIFGADDEADTLDHLGERPSDEEDMVSDLDEVIVALSSLDAFEEALGDDGIFSSEGDAIDGMDLTATDVFEAREQGWTVHLRMSENTRFGVYSKVAREGNRATSKLEPPDDDDDQTTADELMRWGAFAYSPLKASKRASLPSAGEAYYAGMTVAQDHSDDFNTYMGVIEIQVRFRSRRVSGLISQLIDADGEPLMIGFGTVDSIILPNGDLESGADWDTGALDGADDPVAQVVYVAQPGSPRPQNLFSQFKGQLVGEGDDSGTAAIGTWTLSSDNEVGASDSDLRGAFGVERGADLPTVRPIFDDDGENSKTSLAADNADPVDDGKIEVGGMDADEKAIKTDVADLFADGGGEVTGANFVEAAVEEIEGQVRLLNSYIALDDVDEDSPDNTANQGREDVWLAIQAALDTIFDDEEVDHDGDDQTNAVSPRILSDSDNDDTSPADGDSDYNIDTYPVTRDSKPADQAAMDEINDILAALRDLDDFEDGTDEDGDLNVEGGTDNALLRAEKEEDVFNRVAYTVEVKYGTTDFTRFGAWVRTGSEHAVDAPTFDQDEVETHTGQFAYSPLAQTKYTSTDPNFPMNGRATYEGSTIARDTDDSLPAPVFYTGDITLEVAWAAAVGTDSDVVAVISNLEDKDGNMYADNTGDLAMIIFDAASSTTNTEDLIAFDGSTGTLDVRGRPPGLGGEERNLTGGAIDGKFVGKGVDGPLGVLGTWEVGDLEGVYGADLVP